MTTIDDAETLKGLRQTSSLAGDAWHAGDASARAYEWWYFDAVSDDGRDALVVIFLDNFVFSPRYNRAAAHSLIKPSACTDAAQFPAVVCCLYRDGRPIIRAINERTAADFSASVSRPSCRIGASGFELVDSTGGARYVVNIDETLRGGRRLEARFEWTMTEGDFDAHSQNAAPSVDEDKAPGGDVGAHVWNMVAPRCRVSGDITVVGRDGRRESAQAFRGVGYHDHNRDRRWLPSTVAQWQWGRAHFPDATAVFYRYRERGEAAHTTRLFLVRDGALSKHHARFDAGRFRRHHFGLRYPQALSFETTEPGATLHVRQSRVVDSSHFYLRFLGEATLETRGSPSAQHAPALTEHLAPRALRLRWLDRLTDMRIGRHGRAAFLK